MNGPSSSSSSMPILSGLTDQQIAAARATGPVLVLAGAGSGKTKALTAGVACRIAERGIPSERILAVTFTNKAAGEMRERIRTVLGSTAAPSWLGTFHGLGARQLRCDPEVARLRPGFDILDAADSTRILKRLLLGAPKDAAADDQPVDRTRLKRLCDRISSFKDNLIPPAQAAMHVEGVIAQRAAAGDPVDVDHLRLAARLYVAYQAELRDMNAADFGDLLLWPALTMLSDETYRRGWASRFDSVLADEFQDVNRAQFIWLRALSRDHGEIFVVGDDSQSIYSWRGSDIGYIRRFREDFPGTTLIKLEQNFRSTGHILSAANAVISHDPSRLKKTLFTALGDGERIEVVRFGYASEEAAGIVSEIGRRAAEGVPYEQMAILYRANFLSREIEEKLLLAKVPYTIIGDTGFYQRTSVKDALALLRLSASPDDRQSDEAFRRVANKPARGIGAKALGLLEVEAGWRDISLLAAVETTALPRAAGDRLRAFVATIRTIGTDGEPSLSRRLQSLLTATGYLTMLRQNGVDDAEEQLANVMELVGLAEGFRSVTELLEHAALASIVQRDQAGGRVQLMTLHRAKGLEFPHVFLPAWEAGIFPGNNSLNLDEERRLAYVALTPRHAPRGDNMVRLSPGTAVHPVAVHRPPAGRDDDHGLAALSHCRGPDGEAAIARRARPHRSRDGRLGTVVTRPSGSTVASLATALSAYCRISGARCRCTVNTYSISTGGDGAGIGGRGRERRTMPVRRRRGKCGLGWYSGL